MISITSIIHAIRGVFPAPTGVTGGRLMHPQRDWLIGIFLFTVVVITGSILFGRLYLTYQEVGTSAAAQTAPVTRYKVEVVQDVLEAYRDRKAAYNLFKNKTPQPPLPVVAPIEVAPVASSTEAVLPLPTSEEVIVQE